MDHCPVEGRVRSATQNYGSKLKYSIKLQFFLHVSLFLSCAEVSLYTSLKFMTFHKQVPRPPHEVKQVETCSDLVKGRPREVEFSLQSCFSKDKALNVLTLSV